MIRWQTWDMRLVSLRLLAGIGLVVLGPGLAAAQVPSFTLIPPAPGATGAIATSLSSDGRTAAGYSFGPSGYSPGFVWTAQGGRYDFGLELGVPTFTQSAAISGDGTTVTGRSNTGAAGSRAFRWSGPGTYLDLGTRVPYPRSFG